MNRLDEIGQTALALIACIQIKELLHTKMELRLFDHSLREWPSVGPMAGVTWKWKRELERVRKRERMRKRERERTRGLAPFPGSAWLGLVLF